MLSMGDDISHPGFAQCNGQEDGETNGICLGRSYGLGHRDSNYGRSLRHLASNFHGASRAVWWLMLLLHVGSSASQLCQIPIAGIFQMRRSPAGLQREAAARAAFCDVFPGCSPSGGAFNIGTPSRTSHYRLWGSDNSLGINVTYHLFSESSSTANTDVNRAIEEAIEAVVSRLVVAILGPNSSSSSKGINPISQIFSVPYLSYAATSTELSDVATYPNFFRVCPPDSSQAEAIVALMKKSGWKDIAVMNTRDTYGSTGAAAVVTKATAAGIETLTQQEMFAGETDMNSISALVRRVKSSGARVIILFMIEQDAANVLNAAVIGNMVGPGWVWISSDGFTSTEFSLYGIEPAAKGFLGISQGTTYNNPQFFEFNKSWSEQTNVPGNIITNFRNLSATYSNIPTAALPTSYSSYGNRLNGYAPFAYDAMKLLLTAIRNLALTGTTLCTSGNIDSYRMAIADSMKNLTLNGTTGTISFDSNQDRLFAGYEIQNHDGASWKAIARWDFIRGFDFYPGFNEENSPVWPGGQAGFANAPPAQIPVGPSQQDDSEVYFYTILALIPFMAGGFYYLMKKKGDEWAEFLSKIIGDITRILIDVLLNLIDFATDALSYLYVLQTPSLSHYVIPYTVFMILAGISIVTYTVLAALWLWSLTCKKEGKYAMAEELGDKLEAMANKLALTSARSSKRREANAHIYLIDGSLVRIKNKKQLQFMLHKAYHGIRMGFVALCTAIFEDFPFMVINAMILVQEGEVNVAILASFAFNCYICGTMPATYRELVLNLNTSRTVLIAITKMREAREFDEEGKGANNLTNLDGDVCHLRVNSGIGESTMDLGKNMNTSNTLASSNRRGSGPNTKSRSKIITHRSSSTHLLKQLSDTGRLSIKGKNSVRDMKKSPRRCVFPEDEDSVRPNAKMSKSGSPSNREGKGRVALRNGQRGDKCDDKSKLDRGDRGDKCNEAGLKVDGKGEGEGGKVEGEGEGRGEPKSQPQESRRRSCRKTSRRTSRSPKTEPGSAPIKGKTLKALSDLLPDIHENSSPPISTLPSSQPLQNLPPEQGPAPTPIPRDHSSPTALSTDNSLGGVTPPPETMIAMGERRRQRSISAHSNR